MSPYLISGKLRKEKKKELAELKFYVKSFWHFEDIDRVYGGGLSDSDCQKLILKAETQIKELELELLKPALDIQRESKLNCILPPK